MTASLKKRLILILLLLMLFGWISSAILTVIASSRVLIDQVDRQLEQYSDLVWYMTQVFVHVDGGHPPGSEALFIDGADLEQLPHIIKGSPQEELATALNIWHGDHFVAALEHSPQFQHPRKEGFAFQRDPERE